MRVIRLGLRQKPNAMAHRIGSYPISGYRFIRLGKDVVDIEITQVDVGLNTHRRTVNIHPESIKGGGRNGAGAGGEAER